MNWIKRLLIATVLPLISVIFAVGAFEIFLTYDNYYPMPKRNQVEIEGLVYGFITENNSSFFSEPDPETKDIFLVGDSFTEGVHCSTKKSDFPSLMQTKLDGQFKIHNLGVGGKNTADYVDIISHLKLDKSDTVVVVLYDNDIHLSPQNCDQIQRQSKSSGLYIPNMCIGTNEQRVDKSNATFLQWVNNKVKKFKTIQLIKESAVNIPSLTKYFYRNEYIARWNDFNAEETKWVVSSLNLIKEIVKESGAEIKFTYYPNTNAINSSDPRHSVWKIFIAEVFKQNAITIDDPYPYFIENATSESMVWSLTDKHPSCAAHNIMSDHISKFLIK
ncbi:SGNH/GDSL hydrolase family protein [Planktomarina temperata]|nr:SGNH/GDSL hydrolase family protein [Planktomarina temperata]